MKQSEYLLAYAEQLELDAVYCRRVASCVDHSKTYWDKKADNLEQKAQNARKKARELMRESD